MVSGKTATKMDVAFIPTHEETELSVLGTTTSCTERSAFTPRSKEASIKVNTRKARGLEGAFTWQAMAQSTMVTFVLAKSMAWAPLFVDANGDKYTGDFSFGKAHGKGTRTFPNGSVFKGQFRFGVENGEGTLTVRGAAVHDAQWIRAKSGNVLIASCGAIFSCILAPQQPLSLPLLQQKKTQREN
jgi:hypothetical protein